MEELEQHEYANIFPMMAGAELDALAESIRHGYDESMPIVLLDGKILDGRNRYKACQMANVPPVFTAYDGDDPLEFVIRHNLTRRHLNETQRAGVAAKLANMPRGGAEYRSPNLDTDKISRKQAADLLNVGKSTVATYRAVAAAMPELVPLMDEGKMTAHEASKKVKEVERTKERKQVAEKAKAIPLSSRWQVHHGDMTKIKLDRQFNFIITDPPYPKEYLYLYEQLAIRANDWLFDGGLLVAMCGQSYLDQIYNMMSQHLDYYWTAAYLTPGQPTPLRQVNVNTTWKPLLIFKKGNYKGKIFGDVFISDGNDKSMHKWGQSESGMTSIIAGMCLEGQSILDPFCGAGTTLVSGLKHNCFVTGIELEEENSNIARGRLAEL